MLLDFYSPSTCPACRRETRKPGLCPNCHPVAELGEKGRCRRCFLRLSRSDGICPFCSSRNVLFDRHVSTFGLNRETKRVLQAWKFENDRKAYRTFLPFVRKRLDHLLQEEDIIHQTGLLAYIGSGSSAASIRNYQPVKDMAGELQGRNLQACAPLKKSVVRKQSGENRKNRFFQVRNSIQLTEEYRVAQYYVILEDLFTTGATANEASRILKKRSAAPVFVLSLFMAD